MWGGGGGTGMWRDRERGRERAGRLSWGRCGVGGGEWDEKGELKIRNRLPSNDTW